MARPFVVRLVAVLVVLAAPIAHADEPTEPADEPTELHDEVHEGLTRQASEPQLHLDLATPLRAFAEGYDADVMRQTAQFKLGPHTRATIESNGWASPLFDADARYAGPSPLFNAQGWGTGLRLEHDLGPFVLAAEVSYNRVDSALAHGSYRIDGISLRRTFKLSRWMTAWIALTAGRRTWLGQPPPGETNDTSVMLSIGTTFR